MSKLFTDFRQSSFFTLLTIASHVSLALIKISVATVGNIPVSIQLLPTAIACIFIGSLQSVMDPTSEQAQDVERMKPEDAYKFPVFGSITLFSFYLCIKYLPKNILEFVTRIVFCLIGGLSMHEYFDALGETFLPPSIKNMTNVPIFSFSLEWRTLLSLPYDIKLQIPIPKHATVDTAQNQEQSDGDDDDDSASPTSAVQNIAIQRLDLLTFPMGFAVSGWWYLTEHWIANNLIGESFCMQAIALLNPGSYFTGAVLLALLFVYDIFWVFGTEVMVTVAKGLKAPIKLVFPRGGDSKPSALGLGDIVLPGIYLALLLRYDVVRKERGSNAQMFFVAMICYVLSLGMCLFVMFYFEHAQPALLYISPGVTLPVMGYALLKGEFNDLWSYEEEDHAKQS